METPASSPAFTSPAERHYHAKCFFSSSNLSDVKIRFGGKDVDAHKIILARGSRYFERIFAGDGMVQHGRRVHLNNIDTEAAKGMLAWIYDTEYQHNDRYVDKAGLTYETKTPLEAQQYALYLLDLYIAAKKYEVSGLAAEVELRMEHVFMLVMLRVDGERAGVHASEVACKLYTKRGVQEQLIHNLRRTFVRHFEIVYSMEKGTELLEACMLEYPGLAIDVLRRLTKKDESD
ncbi:hypothetical protein LTR56_019984 [Elasticomyces elasticus]|nr:hypothetical protein LTR56_019984 [Elasticomyces elasticus]KAK3634093.1 hypothetical protein LTR22_019825 [Elasticomyces elasticus]KAK4911178.1 hypothetical protein LTR49_020250 [Elasticomyces elasticus]KAK5748015.1 hypothetical protein LTS12_021944 [Elasticomyces elasticus]